MDESRTELLKLIQEFLAREWDELELVTDEWQVSLRRHAGGGTVASARGETVVLRLPPSPEPVAVPSSEPQEKTPEPESLKSGLSEGEPLVAPIAGIFYRRPSPGEPPFVEVGQVVAVGETICIIEVMKLMCEVKAELAGVVTTVCVEDGTPVEKGDALFLVSQT